MGVDHDFTRNQWERKRKLWDNAIVECRMTVRWVKTRGGYECHGTTPYSPDTIYLGFYRKINYSAVLATIRDLYPDVPQENIILDHVEVTPRRRRWG